MSTIDLSHIIVATKALTKEAVSHGRRDILDEMSDIITTARDSPDNNEDGSEDGEIIERRGALSAPSTKRLSKVTGANAIPVKPRNPGPEPGNAGSSTKRLPARNPVQERYEHSIRKEHRNQQERQTQHQHDPPQPLTQQPEQRLIQLPQRQPDKHKIFQASILCAFAEIAEPTAVKTLTAQTIGHEGGFTLLAEKVTLLQQSEQVTKKWVVVFEKAPQIGDVTFSIEFALGGEGEGEGVFLALFSPAVKVEGGGRGCAVCANKGHGCAGCPFVEEVTAGVGEE